MDAIFGVILYHNQANNGKTRVSKQLDHNMIGNYGLIFKFRGKLRDTILDWEDSLPFDDLAASEQHSRYKNLSMYETAHFA